MKKKTTPKFKGHTDFHPHLSATDLILSLIITIRNIASKATFSAIVISSNFSIYGSYWSLVDFFSFMK